MSKNTGDFIIQILENLPDDEMLYKMARCKWRGVPEMYEEGVRWWKKVFDVKKIMNEHNYDIIVIIVQDFLPNSECIGHVIFYQNTNDGSQWLLSDLKTSEAFRLKGIASIMIYTALEKIKNLNGKEVFAFIDNDNLPSINLHTKLGFEKVKYEKFDEFTIQENESTFKLELNKIK